LTIIIEIAVLVAACSVVVLAILAIPILLDLRRIVRDWKKASEILKIGMMPATWFISFLASVFQKLVEKGEEASKETKTDANG
jgi:cytochrome c oxidase assembly factor CtaG